MADLARIILCPTHTLIRLVFGSRTLNCRNMFNIGPYDLIFLLKDRQLKLQEKIGAINFVHDHPLLRYLQLKLPLVHIVLSWTHFFEKFFQN